MGNTWIVDLRHYLEPSGAFAVADARHDVVAPAPSCCIPATPRCPRTAPRPPPALRGSHGSTGRRDAARPLGTACRTAYGTDSSARPSLWHGAPPVASEHSAELLGCPISRSSLLLTLVLNQGPFPPPALPGFLGTTDLSATLCRPACPSRAAGWTFAPSTAKGFPCCIDLPALTCHRHYPGGPAGCVRRSLPQPWQPSPRLRSGRPPH